MSDFEQLIENNLAALRAGKAIAVCVENWKGIVANAAWDAVLEPSAQTELENLLATTHPVLFLANERQLVQAISAYDLEATDDLEKGKWLRMEGVLGIADQWLDHRQSAQVALALDPLLFGLIRRLRAPLVGFRIGT